MGDGHIRIGTSGWHYKHWVGPFYPDGLPATRFLDAYARHLATAEINNTFYSLPKPATLEDWARRTPDNFLFAVKASRFITHMKKLKDPARSIERFFSVTGALGTKRGPVLFQLPPNWRANPDRLAAFLDALPHGPRYAFEFRDESWFTEPVLRLLEDAGAALCIYEIGGRRSPVELTAGFSYVRLHGPSEHAYQGSYDGHALAGWARRFANWAEQGRDVYCYFDNDEAGHAANDALRLIDSLEKMAA